MLTSIKRSLYALSNKLRRQSGPMREKWIADFSKPEKSCFDIKPEISFNAYLEKGSLFLGLKKKNCMAWLETSRRVYVDQVINARFRLDSFGNYCSAGIMFRVMERGTYYIALISSKGYFRFDAVNKGVPVPLIGWTETPGINERGVNLTVIAKGDHIIFILNGRWIAETRDNSVPGGHLGFPLVSYEPDSTENALQGGPQPDTTGDRYSCQAWLDFLSVDSRAGTVENEYEKWKDSPEITAESRLRLAESLAALDRASAAYEQILRAWKQREEAARSVSATYTEMRARGELLLAARLTERLGRFAAAEDYINTCIAMGTDGGAFELTEIFAEKVKILSSQNKYGDLAAFLPVYINRMKEIPPAGGPASGESPLPALYALLGLACRNLKEHEAAAGAWDAAFNLNRNNGLYAVNAADAYELAGRNEKALQRRLSAGKIFLRREDFTETGALIPKILAAGEKNPEARLLATQYAFATGDFDRAESELALYEELRLAIRPVPKADPAAERILGELQSRKKPVKTEIKGLNTAGTIRPSITPPEAVVPEKKESPLAAPVPAKTEGKPADTPAEPVAIKKDGDKPETAVKKPARKKPGEAKPASGTKKAPPAKKAAATAKTETAEKAVKTKAKPAAVAPVKKGGTVKTAPAKAAATEKTAGSGKTAVKTPVKAAKKPAAKKEANTAAKKKPAAKSPVRSKTATQGVADV
jgi:tetratricopeptide (TPR) repeat protein